MKKNLKYVIFFIFICVCFLFTFIYVNHKESKSINNIYTSEILVYADNKEYEIKIDNKTKKTIFREGDIEDVIFTYPREGKPRVSIPDLSKIQGENVIKDIETYIDFTYNVNFQSGCKYLKYLISDGYDFKMYAATPQYFECFLEKDNKIKRLVLFADSLMVCDLLENTQLPEVSEYFKNYNYNGYIEEKFKISFEE